jgi:RimJ/RimL family protein N-acetyltransferase
MTDPVLIDIPTSIETQRLSMRPPQAGDGSTLHAAIAESLEDLRRFSGALPWVDAEQTAESAERHCRRAQSDFIARNVLQFLLFEKTTGELVGSASLHHPVWAVPKLELGYWARTSKAGQGFISEAAAALTSYAFTHLNAARVAIIVDEQNIASRRVAERCGFALEGSFRHDRRAPNGTLRSTCVYARCWLRQSGAFERLGG